MDTWAQMLWLLYSVVMNKMKICEPFVKKTLNKIGIIQQLYKNIEKKSIYVFGHKSIDTMYCI